MNKEETNLNLKQDLIKQSHELNSASYKLSSLAMDIIFVMITQVDKNDHDFKLYEISLRELELKLGKRVNTPYLKKAVKEVMSNPLGTKSDDGSFVYISWASVFKYNATTRKISFRFDSELKPFLLEIKEKFVLSHLKEISSLQSEYAKRIYNLLKQWENKGVYKISVEALQEILQVPKSLIMYSNFKLKVLNIALEQINKNTSIKIEMKEQKTLRKVTSLIFNISKNNKIESKKNIKEEKSFIDKWLND